MRHFRRRILLNALLVAAAFPCFGQDSASHALLYGEGITAQGSIGYSAVRDDHISTGKYSGTVSSAALQWSRVHESYLFRLEMLYQKAASIKNHNVSAEVSAGEIALTELYPLQPWTLFGTEVNVGLGPWADVYTHYRKQHIAINSGATPDVYESTAWLFSLGVRLEAVVPIGDSFQAGAAIQSGVLSMGGGTGGDPHSGTNLTLLTPLAGLHARSEIVISYRPFEFISIAAGYRFDILRVDSWNYLVDASDIGFLALTCHI